MSISIPGYFENLTPDDEAEIFPQEQEETTSEKGINSGNEKLLKEITNIIYDVDGESKALTGRTPERIFQETGVPTEVMFPKNAKILYVGDPWQRMGRELDATHGSNFTLIDYEFGDIASFVKEDGLFRDTIHQRAKNLLSEITSALSVDVKEDYSEIDLEWLYKFKDYVTTAYELSESAKTDQEYLAASRAWNTAKKFVEESHKAEMDKQAQQEAEPGDSVSSLDNIESALSYLRASAWYDCVYGERGFKDIPDWNNIIKPKLDSLKQQLTDLPEEDANRKIDVALRSWIGEIRLKKNTEKTNVVEAIFPELPFKSESFDRLVASWSISAHVFAGLDEEEFDVFWSETYRVLRSGGEAYIFPLNYYYAVNETLINSLEAMKFKYSDVSYEILDSEGQPVSNPIYSDNNYTLVINKLSGNKAT
jgi:hypothetical protein